MKIVKDSDLVSIAIPCYNSAKYLPKCLDSLLKQTYSNIEVIVVNDGSTDQTEEILKDYQKKFNEKKIRYIYLKQSNQGQAAAINLALKSATGDYLMWQDSDDWYEFDAVASLLSYLKKEKLNIVRGESALRSPDGSKILMYGKSKKPFDRDIFYDVLYQKDIYCFVGVFMIKMSFFDSRVLNRHLYVSREGQNFQLILPNTYNEKCGYLNKVVYNLRETPNSHSRQHRTMKQKIKRNNGVFKILFNTVKTIKMPRKEIRKIIFKLRKKYFFENIKILLRNKYTLHIKNKFFSSKK